jgi:hypothetical protein
MVAWGAADEAIPLGYITSAACGLKEWSAMSVKAAFPLRVVAGVDLEDSRVGVLGCVGMREMLERHL